MNKPLINYLEQYRPLPVEDRDSIAGAFVPRFFKEGDYLFHSGGICKEFFFIEKGVLKIVVHQEKGNDVIPFFIKENRFCTILNSFNNQVPAEESIQAACDVQVLGIHREDLLCLYNRLPYLKGFIDQITQQSLLDKIQVRNELLGQNSTARYQMFLTRQPDIAQRVSLNDIASYLGVTPQSLSRIRRNFR